MSLSNITADELKTIVQAALREELSACGILASTPEQRVSTQSDFAFLRRLHAVWDNTVNKVGTAVLLALFGLAATVSLGWFKFGK